jgi:hypothetical protein
MEAEGNKERREVVAPDLTVLFPPPRSLAGTRRLLHHWLRHRKAATPDPARLCRLLRREVISVEKRGRGAEAECRCGEDEARRPSVSEVEWRIVGE